MFVGLFLFGFCYLLFVIVIIFLTKFFSSFFHSFLTNNNTPMFCLQVLRVTSSRILNCKVVKDPTSASRENEYGELLDFNLVNAVNGGSGHSTSASTTTTTTTTSTGTIKREGEDEDEDEDEEGERGRTMMHGGRYLRVTKSHHFDDVKVSSFFFLSFLSFVCDFNCCCESLFSNTQLICFLFSFSLVIFPCHFPFHFFHFSFFSKKKKNDKKLKIVIYNVHPIRF